MCVEEAERVGGFSHSDLPWCPAAPAAARQSRKGLLLLGLGALVLAAVAGGGWLAYRYFTTGSIVISGAPPGARVTLDGAAHAAADAGGDLVIAGLRRGTYLVEISAPGFVTQGQRVEMLSRETPVTFALTRDAKLHVVQGSRHLAEKNFPAAEQQFREAVGIEPNDPGHRKLLADALLKQNKVVEAEAEYRQAVALDDANAEYHRLLAETLLMQAGKEAEAESVYDSACQRSQDKAACYHSAGSVWLKRGSSLEPALRALDKAIGFSREDDPAAGPYFATRAAALLASDRTEEALDDAKRAVELASENAACQSALGDVYSGINQFDGAVSAYRQAVRIVPGNDDYQSRLAKALYDRARDDYAPLSRLLSDLRDAKAAYLEAILLAEDGGRRKKYVEGIRRVDERLGALQSSSTGEEGDTPGADQ